MSPRISHSRRSFRAAGMTFGCQALVAVVLAVVGLFLGLEIAIAVLVGALICALAQLIFALVALRPKVGASSGSMLSALYMGAMSKFFITVVLFACALGLVEFLQIPTNAAAMLLAYAITQLSLMWSPKA